VNEARPQLVAVGRADLDDLRWLNDQAVPAVNRLSAEELQRFADTAPYFRVARIGGMTAGFLIGLTQESEYHSPNFRFFKEKFDAFAYVDRIVIGAEARGAGLGRQLYHDFELWARSRDLPRLTCEVNLQPPNERSLRFHQRAGFRKVGRQFTEGGAKEVVLLEKPLS